MKEHGGKVGIGELEVPLVVELEERRAVWVVVLQVKVVDLGLRGGVATVLADVHLKGRTQSLKDPSQSVKNINPYL